MNKRSYWETRLSDMTKKAFEGNINSRQRLEFKLVITVPGDSPDEYGEDYSDMIRIIRRAVGDSLPPGARLSELVSNWDTQFESGSDDY
jgi:hypothetical protein